MLVDSVNGNMENTTQDQVTWRFDLPAGQKQNLQVQVKGNAEARLRIQEKQKAEEKKGSKDGGDLRQRRADEAEARGGQRWSKDLPFQCLRSGKTEKSSSKH